MARKYTFNTLRIVCLRNDEVIDDDSFFVDILADGVSTMKLDEAKTAEVAEFLFDFMQKFSDLCVDAYNRKKDEASTNDEGRRDADV